MYVSRDTVVSQR